MREDEGVRQQGLARREGEFMQESISVKKDLLEWAGILHSGG
jgi:hypothetical protein